MKHFDESRKNEMCFSPKNVCTQKLYILMLFRWLSITITEYLTHAEHNHLA